MFKLNLKIALRNLFNNKAYTAVNIVGLALGLAGFIFILLYVNYEKSYDHWNENLVNVYQVQELNHWQIKEGKEEWQDVADARLISLFKTSVPQVQEMAQFSSVNEERSIILDNREPFLQDKIAVATSAFFSVFPHEFIYGDASAAFSKPGSIVIKEGFAKKHFGAANPVGKTMMIAQQNWADPDPFTITGVIAETSTPSSLDFEILQYWNQGPASDSFYTFAETYARMDENPSLSLINQTAQSIYFPFKMALLKRQKQPESKYLVHGIKPSVRLIPLESIHQNPLWGVNWLTAIKPIILLSTLLLFISIINFVNMFTAQAVSRAKEVGVKKVIGADRKSLIIQFLSETALQCILALLLGIILLEGFLPYLNRLFELSLSFSISRDNMFIVAQLAALLVVIILLAGIYPAFFLSSYRPQEVLKGNLGQSNKGKILRSTLVALQFVIAVGFLIGIMIISAQMQFMEQRDPGFSTQAVINIRSQFDKKLAEQFEAVDGVSYVGSNNGMIGRNQKMTGQYKYQKESKELNTVLVNFEGLQALGVKLVSGRLFDSKSVQDSLSSIILNETLEREYGGNMVGKFIHINDNPPALVVGVIKDIQVSGFENLILPTVYTASRNNATGYPNKGVNYVVKFQADKQKSVLSDLDKVWKRNYPAFPLKYTFVKDDLAKVLVPHQRFKQMVKLFSVLSIALSLIGLFALAAFMTKRRTKEIAIRKVMGADNIDIFVLLNKGYLWLMLGANVISWPLIYVAVQHWLSDFAYRIEMPVLPFIIAFGVSLIVTVITVSLQVNNAVKANPVKALKYE